MPERMENTAALEDRIAELKRQLADAEAQLSRAESRDPSARAAAGRDAAASVPRADLAALLQLVLDTIPVRVFWKDRSSRFLGCNKLLAQDAGLFHPFQIVGRTDRDFPWREEAGRYRADDLYVMANGIAKVNYEEPQKTPDGKRIWLRTTKVPMRDATGEVVGVLGTYEDITERKLADEALQKRLLTLTQPLDDVSTLRFADLFDIEEIQKIQDAFAEATGVASVITELDGRPITRPSNFCHLCTIIRKTEQGLVNCMSSDAALGQMNPCGPTIQPCLSGGLWDGGTSICVGDRHIANWLVGQVRDDTQHNEKMPEYGRRIGADMEEYQAALQEVTQMPRVQFEKVCKALHLIARQLSQLALQNVQQARAITERQRAETALIEAHRRKDEFLAMLSHELRNPLAPIRNSVQILHLVGTDDPKLQRQRDIIDRQVSHMARLLDDLLDVSRITRGKIRLKKTRLDLCEVLDRAIETVRGTLEGHGQSLIFHRAEAPQLALGDATRLEQVLINLINNASKYSDKASRIWVTMSADEAQNEAVIEVRDEGVGIAPEILPKVFDLFTQASQSLDRSQGGLGIGLTLVRRLVEMHDGTVEAASPGLGRGSSFTVRLPLLAACSWHWEGEEGARAQPEVSPGAADMTRVLVVDDIIDTADSMAEILGIWGYLVEVAHDGPKAITAAQAFRPEIVLLDIGLPGMDGYEVARRLRRDVGMDHAVLIALTGYGTEEDRQRAIGAGFNYHFAKPVDMERLQAALAKGVRGRR